MKDLSSEQREWKAPPAAARRREMSVAICLTLFNEGPALFGPTLVSVIEGLSRLHAQDPRYDRAIIAIIVDGANHLDVETADYLNGLELPPRQSATPGISQAERQLDRGQTARLFGAHRACDMTITLRLITKAENAGKLDSHWWFYEQICPAFDPDYCIQIDTGSVLEPDALSRLCDTFERDPAIAAIAGNILIAPPEDRSLLQRFQCGDFVIQKTIRWPAEALNGFLTVLPGQFSGLRWSSLTRRSEAGRGTPKDRYLRGLDCRSAHERLMFLAEDRVLGVELLSDPGAGNRLEFAPEATCHTDACAGLGELLEQRRRWLNGFLACRVWMIAVLLRMLTAPGSRLAGRISTGVSLVNLALQHLLEWFLPAVNLLLLAGTCTSLSLLASGNPAREMLATGLFAVMATIWILPALLAVSGHIQHWSKRRVEFLISMVLADAVLILAINAMALARQPGLASYAWLVALPFVIPLATALGALLLNRALLRHLRASIMTFVALAPALWLMMSAYAFTRLDDASWGTKGLSASDATRPDLRRLRGWVVMGWTVSNSALAGAVLWFEQLSSTMLAIGSLHLALIAAGLLGALRIRGHRPAQHAPSAQRAEPLPERASPARATPGPENAS